MFSRWCSLSIHPHEGRNVPIPFGHVLAVVLVRIALALDPVRRRGAVTPVVGHLVVHGHVVGVGLGGGRELGVEGQRRELGLLPLAVVGLEDGSNGLLLVERGLVPVFDGRRSGRSVRPRRRSIPSASRGWFGRTWGGHQVGEGRRSVQWRSLRPRVCNRHAARADVHSLTHSPSSLRMMSPSFM